jgi:hypothetical protein
LEDFRVETVADLDLGGPESGKDGDLGVAEDEPKNRRKDDSFLFRPGDFPWLSRTELNRA